MIQFFCASVYRGVSSLIEYVEEFGQVPLISSTHKHPRYTYGHTDSHNHTQTHTHRHTHSHINIHSTLTHTHTHTHTHTCVDSWYELAEIIVNIWRYIQRKQSWWILRIFQQFICGTATVFLHNFNSFWVLRKGWWVIKYSIKQKQEQEVGRVSALAGCLTS